MTCDSSILTKNQPTAQAKKAEEPQSQDWLNGVPAFASPMYGNPAARRYIPDLPPMADRIERARVRLNDFNPHGKETWSDEGIRVEDGDPRGLVAHILIIHLALDSTSALALLKDFNKRCPSPMSDQELQALIDEADGRPNLRGLWHLTDLKERPDDPHRLAQQFLERDRIKEEARLEDAAEEELICKSPPPRWRYWREQWLRWDGTRYIVVADKELRGKLTASIRKSLESHHRREAGRLSDAYQKELAGLPPLSGQGKLKPPAIPQVIPVTAQMVNNTLQALESIAAVPFATEQPSWLGEKGQAESLRCIAFANGLIDLEAALQGTATLGESRCSRNGSVTASRPAPITRSFSCWSVKATTARA